MHIVTHDGPFHADDVFAVALLEMAHKDINLVVSRTRDIDVINEADIAVDVGKQFQPAEGRFDHHQVDDPSQMSRMNGVPLASTGMIWREYSPEVCQPYESTHHLLFEGLDQELIEGIDAMDVGYDQPHDRFGTISEMITHFRPTYQEDVSMSDRFPDAVEFAKGVLKRYLRKLDAEHSSYARIRNATQVMLRENYDALVLDEYVPWKKALEESPFDNVAFVIHPKDDEWHIVQVPENPSSYEPKHFGFPQNTQGLEGDGLKNEMDIQEAVFVHHTGFLGVSKTVESAIQMAQYAAKKAVENMA